MNATETKQSKWGLDEPVSKRSELRSEIEEVDADLESAGFELEEIRERIAALKKQRAELVARYKSLKR